jgi:hypothetical protein
VEAEPGHTLTQRLVVKELTSPSLRTKLIANSSDCGIICIVKQNSAQMPEDIPQREVSDYGFLQINLESDL